MFGVIVTLLAVAGIAYLVIKNYYPPTILLLLGLVLLVIGGLMGNDPVTGKTATNFFGFDLAQAFTDLMKRRLPGLGLNIMAIAGFSFYMNKIGASKALVKLCIRPLSAHPLPVSIISHDVRRRTGHGALHQFRSRSRSIAHGIDLPSACFSRRTASRGCSRHWIDVLLGPGTELFKCHACCRFA